MGSKKQKRSLQGPLSMFGERAKDGDLWNQAMELMEPFAAIRDRGRFQSSVPPTAEEAERAFKPIDTSVAVRWSSCPAGQLYACDPDHFKDLADMLRASSLKETIPQGSMFNGLGLILGDLFMSRPPEKNLATAVRDQVSALSARRSRLDAWQKILMHNFGGLFVHLLWHAFEGRREQVEQLKPLCELMGKTPIAGRHRPDGRWLVLTV